MPAQGDQVAAVRTVSIVTTDGRREPGLTVVDVWRVAGGRVVSGEQCWQVSA